MIPKITTEIGNGIKVKIIDFEIVPPKKCPNCGFKLTYYQPTKRSYYEIERLPFYNEKGVVVAYNTHSISHRRYCMKYK